MSYPMDETALVKRMQTELKRRFPGAWLLKTHGGRYQAKGMPDLIVCVAGQLYAFEAKHRKPGESLEAMHRRVTLSQRIELSRMEASGAVAAVVWEVDHPARIVAGDRIPGTEVDL